MKPQEIRAMSADEFEAFRVGTDCRNLSAESFAVFRARVTQLTNTNAPAGAETLKGLDAARLTTTEQALLRNYLSFGGPQPQELARAMQRQRREDATRE